MLTIKLNQQLKRIEIKEFELDNKIVFEYFNNLSVNERDVLRVLRGIEARGALSIAKKCRSWLFELFQHALAEGLIGSNPAAEMAVLALPKNPMQHNPFLRQEELPAFLVKLSGYQGSAQTRLGILLLLLTGVRTGELRQATPTQFDLGKGVWCIQAEQVKQLQRCVRHNGGFLLMWCRCLGSRLVLLKSCCH